MNNPRPACLRYHFGLLIGSDRWQIAGVDTLRASKRLKRWVDQGALLHDDSGGKRHKLDTKLMPDSDAGAEAPLSLPLDNGQGL